MAALEIRQHSGATVVTPEQVGVYIHNKIGHQGEALIADPWEKWQIFRRANIKEDEDMGIDGWLGRRPVNFKADPNEYNKRWGKIRREYSQNPRILDQEVIPVLLPREDYRRLAANPGLRDQWAKSALEDLIKRLDLLDPTEQLGQKLAAEIEEVRNGRLEAAKELQSGQSEGK